MDDLPAVLDLWILQHDYHIDLDSHYYAPDSEKLVDDFAREYFRKAIEKGEPRILVARSESGVVGFITFEIKSSPKSEGVDVAVSGSNITNYGEIIDLFVIDAVRGKKIGAQLMERAENFFKKQGVKHIMLDVSTHNTKTLAYYQEKHGYQPSQIVLFKDI